MAFGTKTKIETADQIRSAFTAAFEEFKNDPELVTARTAHEGAQRVASAANARLAECESALHALAVSLTPDGQELLARVVTIEQKIATNKRTIAEINAGADNYSKSTKLALLREGIGNLERELGDAKYAIAGLRRRPSDPQLLAAPVDQRRAYRAAEASLETARQAAKATVEPLQDATQDLARARAAAVARIKPKVLQLRGIAVRRFDAALEAAKQENDLVDHVTGRINGTLGAGVVSGVCWSEFADPYPGFTPRLAAWRDSLRTNAPEAEISA